MNVLTVNFRALSDGKRDIFVGGQDSIGVYMGDMPPTVVEVEEKYCE